MDALRLDNSILTFDSVARCRLCREWDDIDILFPVRVFRDEALMTYYSHLGCIEGV